MGGAGRLEMPAGTHLEPPSLAGEKRTVLDAYSAEGALK